VRGEKGGRELLEKAVGDECVFIPWQRPQAGRNAAGGEGGHGAAKLDSVIHR
jgi:hypothetical protein